METANKIAFIIFILLIAGLVSLVPYSMGHKTGYKSGQIDALNGKIYWQLKRQDDSEFRWIECPDVCEYGKKADEGQK